MDPFDKSQTDKVWQRVLNHSGGQRTGGTIAAGNSTAGEAPVGISPADAVPQLLPMIEQVRAAAVCYLALSRRAAGRAGNLLRRLYEEKQNQLDCLAGLYFLLRGSRPGAGTAKPPNQEPLETSLRRCYGAEMRLLAALEEAAGVPEYGPVFRKLAQQTQEHCRLILELLGRNGRML